MKLPDAPPRTTPGEGWISASKRLTVPCQAWPYHQPPRSCGRSPGLSLGQPSVTSVPPTNFASFQSITG